MEIHSAESWVIICLIAGLGVLGVLSQMGAMVRNETYIHDLKVRVHRLRLEQVERFREMAAKSEAYTTAPDGVMIVGEADPVAVAPRRQAA